MMKLISRAALACIFASALSAASCGGKNDSTSPSAPTPPSAPFSAIDLTVGTGTTATLGRTATVSYTGWLYDPTKTESKGTQFDSSASFPFQIGGNVIAGFTQGVLNMRVGGIRRVTIPPNLGYGSAAQARIPANSTLVFDIMLLSVN
jgi:FKBP-type peptidyl-prolyl cis-trans isomerase FkpA